MTGNESRYTSPFETRPGYYNSTSSVLAEQENTSATAKTYNLFLFTSRMSYSQINGKRQIVENSNKFLN